MYRTYNNINSKSTENMKKNMETLELTSDLIAVQGVLINCQERTGEFTKINYPGGNEHHIQYIQTELGKLFTSKQLLQDNKISPSHLDELNKIVFFLGLNTQFKQSPLALDQYTHLVNIIPRLSKCLLAHICFGLNLIKPYCFLMEKFSLEGTQELLEQIMECLRKKKGDAYVNHAFTILKSVIDKLSSSEITSETKDTIEGIVKISTIILQNLTCLTTEQATSMKQLKIYEHMGRSVVQFLDLLLYIDSNNETLTDLTKSIITTTGLIMKCVTIDVFCAWAEVSCEDQSLQSLIAGKAYLVTEKYTKHKLASELVGILSTIARKPKTIAEVILDADVSTMIKRVNQKDEHQKLWFRALLNTPVFSDQRVFTCIERWWYLCDENSLEKLFTLPLPKDHNQKQLLFKCARNLNLEALTKVLSIHFHKEKFRWAEDINDQLIVTFNQIEEIITEEKLKEILLLVFQNAKEFFLHFYRIAFKRSHGLIQIFELLKEIATIDRIGLDILLNVLKENAPSVGNVPNYIQLIETMLNCGYFTWEQIVFNVLRPLIDKENEDNLEEVRCYLLILKHFLHLNCSLLREVELFEYMLCCGSKNRIESFLEFHNLRNEIATYCVDYLYHKCIYFKRIEGRKESFPNIGSEMNDSWSNYYKDLFLCDGDVSFLDRVLPDVSLSNYKEGEVDENFIQFLKVIVRCTSLEWTFLLRELVTRSGFSNVSNALSDSMIVLCDLVENQTKNQGEKSEQLLLALQCCLQNFGKFLASVPETRDDQILSINNVCRVLIHIPAPLKLTEGMSLINALPQEALRALSKDKAFIARIVLIKDKELCKALAQKVLASSKKSES